MYLTGSVGFDNTLTLSAGEDSVRAMVTDGTYLYVGLYTSPGKVVKIQLSDLTKVAVLTLDVGEDKVISLTLGQDLDGTVYLYAGLELDPAKIIKINPISLTKVATLILAAGEPNARALRCVGGYLYVASYRLGAAPIVKVRLSDFTEVASLNIGAGFFQLVSLDSDGFYLYACNYNNAPFIIKIDLDTFSVTASIDLSGTISWAKYLYINSGYLYLAGENAIGPHLAKFDLSDFTLVTTLSLGVNNASSLCSNGPCLFITCNLAPGKIVTVFTTNFTKYYTFTLAVGENNPVSSVFDGAYVCVGTDTSPAKIIRKYIQPSVSQLDDKISLIEEEVRTGLYNTVPANAAGVILTTAAAAWTKGNYSEILAAGNVHSQIFITHVVISGITGTDFEVDIATGAAGSEVVKITVPAGAANAGDYIVLPLPSPVKIPADTTPGGGSTGNPRIAGRASANTGGIAKTCKVKLVYRT